MFDTILLTPNCVIIRDEFNRYYSFFHVIREFSLCIFVFCNLSFFLNTEGSFCVNRRIVKLCVFFTGNGLSLASSVTKVTLNHHINRGLFLCNETDFVCMYLFCM